MVALLESLQDFHPLVLVAIVIFWVLIIYGLHPIKRYKYRQFPGPPFRFLVGGLPEVAKYGLETAYTQWKEKYGDIYVVFLGAHPHVVISSPEGMKKAFNLVQKYDYPLTANEMDQKMIDFSMLLQSGPEWAKMRNVWNPEFKTEKLKSYFSIMERGTQQLVERFEATADGSEVDIWPMMGELTMNTIITASVGIGVDDDSEGNIKAMAEQLTKAVRDDIESVDVEDVGMALLYLFPELSGLINYITSAFPAKKQRAGSEARCVEREIFSKLIKGIRSGDPSQNIVNQSSFLYAMSTVRDQQGNLKDELWTLVQSVLYVSAGFETTQNALAYTVYLLASNKDKEAKLIEELDSLPDNFIPTFETVQSLPYLNAVFNESLRLLPPAPYTIRKSKKGMCIDGYEIPTGTWLNLSMYTMHRSPSYYAQPETFQPERWQNLEKQSADAFSPFGGGARRCPGYVFAQLEAKLALINLYKRFTFCLPENAKPLKTKTMITLVPLEGVHVVVNRRHTSSDLIWL